MKLFEDILIGAAIVCLVAWLFYGSAVALPFLSPVAVIWCLWRAEKRKEKEKEQLRTGFKNFLNSLSASAMTGKSMENSMEEIYREFISLYGEKDPVTRSLGIMIREFRYNRSVYEVLNDWGTQTGLDEIQLFAEVYQTAEKSGGNLIRMIRTTADSIQEMISLKQELSAYIHGKKTEQNIMCLMPAGILAYLKLTSPELLDGIYGTTFGILFMSACLAVYVFAIWLGDHMVTAALK